MDVPETFFRYRRCELVDQWYGFVLAHALYSDALAGADIEAFASGEGMGAGEGMAYLRPVLAGFVLLRVCARFSASSEHVVDHSKAFDPFLGLLRQRVIGGTLIGELRLAAFAR